MTALRPNKPVHRATPEEINRVAVLSQQELAESAAYSIVDPRTISEVKIWLRVDQASDSGTLTIPDAKGVANATQSTGANKPTVGTTGNGLAKLTCGVASALVVPINAGGLAATDYFGLSMWLRPTTTAVGAGYIFQIQSSSGLASANKIRCSRTADDMQMHVWQASDIRLGRTESSRIFLYDNVWRFISFEFRGNGATEADRATIKDMGAPVAAQNAVAYETPQGVISSMPTTLATATGSGMLFNNTALNVGFVGDIGPDIFFYDPRTMTQDKLVQLAQFRVPVG